MADSPPILRRYGNVDVQPGGPGNNWYYLSACATMSGPSVPEGDVDLRWCQDPNSAGGFRISSLIETAPDLIEFDLTTKLSKHDYLKELRCPLSMRARFSEYTEREDPAKYDLQLSYCNVRRTEHSYEDLVIANPGDNDEIIITMPQKAMYEYWVQKLTPARTGTLATLGDQPINDVEYCDTATCNSGTESDGCSKIWGVTDADASPYAAPNLVKGTKSSSAFTWVTYPILGLNGNANGIECAGARLVVSGNADSAVIYNDHDGDQDEWQSVVLAHAPAATPHALFARTARELWVGCADGYIYKSTDGASSWTAMHSGEETTQTINAVWAYDSELVYAAGNAGVLLRSKDGGQTWTNLTDVAAYGNVNLLKVIVPPGRPKEVYLGTNNGKVWQSKDEGLTWTQVSFTGDGVGTVDDLDFCGPCNGDVLFILHNDAGPRARILRDLSGGAGGADVEVIMDWFDVIAVGIDLNALACCGVNEIIAAGENYGGYPVVIKAS